MFHTCSIRSSRPEVFCRKGVLKKFTKFIGMQPEACNFIIKETLAQAFSCKFGEIFKKACFYKTPLVAASIPSIVRWQFQKIRDGDTTLIEVGLIKL